MSDPLTPQENRTGELDDLVECRVTLDPGVAPSLDELASLDLDQEANRRKHLGAAEAQYGPTRAIILNRETFEDFQAALRELLELRVRFAANATHLDELQSMLADVSRLCEVEALATHTDTHRQLVRRRDALRWVLSAFEPVLERQESK